MQANQIAGALNVAVNAALDAGKIIAQNIGNLDRIKVTQKDTSEWVSEVDIRAEQFIVEALSTAFPDISILAEEQGLDDRKSDACWVIDPMDGTHNFLHGHPHCAVSIALVMDNTVLAGVVYDPIRNELFSARKGAGAQLDGRRIRVSNTTRLSTSLICTGYAGADDGQAKKWLRNQGLVVPRAQSIHITGSSVLDLAYVAAGRYDGFWEYGLKTWDIAAGALLVQEAGGLISDLSGGTDVFKTGNLVAGSPKVYEKLKHLVTQ